MRTRRPALLALGLWLGLAAAAGAQPLSAIDWLSDSVQAPPAPADALDPPTEPAGQSEISVRPLGAPSLDGLGTLDAAAVGLGPDLWEESDVPTLVRLIETVHAERLPALSEFLITLMQVGGEPPAAATRDGELLLARIDRLLELGALGEARALLEKADLTRADLFRRWFDVSLLSGDGHAACERLSEAPNLDPTLPTRIFCLARLGDWEAAALNLETSVALGLISPGEDALLRRYLDQSNAAEDGDLEQTNRVTPLTFRLYEAIGEPVPTEVLPRAFAHADLSETNGWKTRLSASERLVAAGVLPPERLFATYQEHKPSASGGAFDRAGLVQEFVAALAAGDAAGVAEVLPQLWSEMVNNDLGVAFAQTYGAALEALALDGTAAGLRHRIALLGGAEGRPDGGFLDALARGTPSLAAASDARAGQIQQGYAAEALPQNLSLLLTENRTAEAALVALDLFAAGAEGEAGDLINAIRLLRALGLERVARAAALELMILDPRG